MKLVVVRTRQEAISALVRNVYDSIGRPLAPDNEGLRLLIRYLHILHDAEPFATAETRALVTRHVQDLLALALGAAGDGRALAGGRGARAARLKIIQAHIEQHLGQMEEVSLDSVALHFRISARTLQRLFESDGVTFTEFVLKRRLERAYAELGDIRRETRSVSDIALACGFGNISYFNHQFRVRYGATPSDIRNHRI
jgi:transcriptional regulator GlxA family with amidase domain